MKLSMKKHSIKNTFHPVSNIENVRRYENKYNIHLDDLMMMFLLKIELKRIAKRKNSKTAFVYNNPNNTYVKMSKRMRSQSKEKRGDLTEDLGQDTFESIENRKVEKMGLVKEDKKIIIKDSGKEILMQEKTISETVKSEKEVRDEQIILKHERGEQLTRDEMERMEMVHRDLIDPLEEEEEREEEVKASPNEIIVIKNEEQIVMQTESREVFGSGKRRELEKEMEKRGEEVERLRRERREAEKRAKRVEKQLEDNLQEMENMQQMHQKQMEEMNSAIENLKEQHGELQSEIEKKNEFISLERNDKEGYSGLLEKLQAELNTLKKEKKEEKRSLMAKSKDLEETENNLSKKIKELAESRSQVYDLKNQIAHLKNKNQKLVLGMSAGEDSKLFNEMAKEMESEKDILKFTQEEYDDHMKRIENIMTANETEKLLLQKEIERLRGEAEDLKEEVEKAEKEKEEKKVEEGHEEDALRLQKKQRELEVMKDQNKKLFEDNKTLSNKCGKLKKFRKEVKATSDQMFLQMNRKREIGGQEQVNFDFTETGNPLANIVLATQIFKNENQKNKRESQTTEIEIFNKPEEHKEKKIRASPPIRSRVSPPPKDHFINRQRIPSGEVQEINFEGDESQEEQPKRSKPPANVQYFQIQKKEVLETTEYDRNEYLNRSKSPRVGCLG